VRVVIDGLPITGMSLAIVVEHLLEGWDELDTGDELHLVVGPKAPITIPDSVHVHEIAFGSRAFVSRMRAQSLDVPRLCRRLDADVMLGVLATTTITPLPCPRALIAYDLRHELRPEQFTTKARALRTVSYSVGYRQADAITCISDRTRHDLLASRSWLADRIVRTTHLGADHVDRWPARDPETPDYAIAFGQYGNKNVDLVVEAWSQLHARGTNLPLVLVGLSATDRERTQKAVASRGLTDTITLLPWIPDEDLQRRFAGASRVVFPSDFEGFGLPAAEAMRLGIPLVVTPEPALLEITGGRAAVMTGWDATALADAVVAAGSTTPEQLAAARDQVAALTWSNTAANTRAALGEAIDRYPHSRRYRTRK
jgi:glycosyltransferase involved in cell wall biosynthesis